jgi:hypothetical protein
MNSCFKFLGLFFLEFLKELTPAGGKTNFFWEFAALWRGESCSDSVKALFCKNGGNA